VGGEVNNTISGYFKRYLSFPYVDESSAPSPFDHMWRQKALNKADELLVYIIYAAISDVFERDAFMRAFEERVRAMGLRGEGEVNQDYDRPEYRELKQWLEQYTPAPAAPVQALDAEGDSPRLM